MFRISFEISGTKCTQQVSFRDQQCILGWFRIILSHLLIWFNAQIKMKTNVPKKKKMLSFHGLSTAALDDYSHIRNSLR